VTYTFTPPPTYADPVITGRDGKPKFNPIWLKWFLDQAAFLSTIQNGQVPAAANTLTGSTIASNVLHSSLLDVGIGTLDTMALLHNNPWTAYTPTISASSGTFTAAVGSGYWTSIDKKIFFTETITITTNGTAAGAVVSTLPTAATGGITQVCSGVNTTAVTALEAIIGSNLTIYKYDGTYPGADATTLIVSGFYVGA